MSKIKPRPSFRFKDKAWHEVKVCKHCGHMTPKHYMNGLCERCGSKNSINDYEEMIVKWVGIPYSIFGKLIIKN